MSGIERRPPGVLDKRQETAWNAHHARIMRVLVDLYPRSVRLQALVRATDLSRSTIVTHLSRMVEEGMVYSLGDNQWTLQTMASVELEDVKVKGKKYRWLTRFPIHTSEVNAIIVVRAEGTGVQVRASSPTVELDFKADLAGPQVTGTIVAATRELDIGVKATGSIPGQLASLMVFTCEANAGFAGYLASEDLAYVPSYPPT